MKKLMAILLAVLTVLSLTAVLVSLSVFAADVTDIATVEDLKKMSSTGSYRLVKDIALTDGTTMESFGGTLDGNGKSITGLTAPLFNELSGTVKNLTLTGSIDVSGKTQIGTLANTATAATVEGVVSLVNLTGSRPAAAMVVGGIIGRANDMTSILSCENKGNITVTGAYNAENDNAMGGIVGRMGDGGKIELCVNSGRIFADGNGNSGDFKGAVAGVVGISNGSTQITACLNRGEVKAVYSTLCIAGILGRTETGNSAAPCITSCVNLGNVIKENNKNERPAGIASYMRGGKVISCANLGRISCNNTDACGIIGYYNGSGALLNVEYNYNGGEIAGSASYGIMRVNGTANLRPVSNFVVSGVTACNDNVNAVVCNDKADLITRVTAEKDAGFVSDMPGSAAVNGGWPIARWQCTHAFDLSAAPEGKICSNCGALVEASECRHSFGAWTETKAPTADLPGEKTRTCTLCGAVETAVIPAINGVEPVDGVYSIANGSQLVWLFDNIRTGKVPASATIRLIADVDVEGKLPMLTTTFTGTLDGNGKTIRGITHTLFKQFNGNVRDLTIRGDIDTTASSVDFDTARKAASFALNSESGSFENLVSYVNIKTKRNDMNAGGLVGYTRAGTSFVNCVYMGSYTVEWIGDGAGIGGIVGWSNASGGSTLFDGCVFGGKIVVNGGASGKEVWVGGILGNLTQATVILKNCYSTGSIESNITAGTDYVGGILGVNKNASSTIDFCANKATLKAVNNVGGIVGGITDKTVLNFCANYTVPTAGLAGALCGNAGGKVLNLDSCVDFAVGGALKLSGNGSSSKNCTTSDKVKTITPSVTVNGKEYVRYNVGFALKESGILTTSLSTTEPFAGYFSLRDDGSSHAVRLVILTNYRKIRTSSVTVTLTFKDADGKAVKSLTKKLAAENSDLTLYSSLVAGGVTYFAAENNAMFGFVVKEIPNGSWSSLEVSVKDTKEGTVYYAPAAFSTDQIKISLSDLPSYASLGRVSANTYNAGPGLLLDRTSTTAEDSYMTVISSTTAEKLADYVKTLASAGFTKVSENTMDGDVFYTYQKYGTYLYLYHTAKQKTTRIIADNSSDPLARISYDYVKKAGDRTEIYQYSINYDLANVAGYDPVVYTESGTINCGMCYIIKLPDNRLIMIDSGHEKQSTAKSREGLVKFMRQISGTPEDGKIPVASWFFTHAHGDHVRLASDVLKEYHDVIDLQSVIYNFPSYQVLSGGYDANTFDLKANINKYYPDVTFHKLHTGEQLSMAGVRIDVVFTHEDAVSASGTSQIGDFNASSTVLKVTFDGKTWMILGDISDVAQTAIMGARSREYLKSDIVQVAHHCFNYLNDLYPAIAADIALFPQAWFYAADPNNGQSNLGKYQSVMKYATQQFFAHKYTTKLWVDETGTVQNELLPRYDAQ